ncbi:MAG TPA: site-2 protease family protein [Candidatus Paceibacterota bacterium]|nr:site-2 protease family protein [Candidatus Paceibacterota bacterium]
MQLVDSNTLFFILILIFSVIVHEVAHGYAAHSLGDPTARLAGRLTLNPIPHIDLFGSILIPAFLVLTNAGILFGWAKPVPYNPYNLKNQRWGEALVAFAGPGTNLLIAVIFAFIVRFFGTLLSPQALSLAGAIILINLFLGLFNLIPIPPFDGYTVLSRALSYRHAFALRAFEQRVRSWGPVGLLVVLFLFITLLSGPFANLVFLLFHLLVGG